MYAVISDRGKQLKVVEGEELSVDRLDLAEKEVLRVDEVLLLQTEKELLIGTPHVENAYVSCEVLSHYRGKKVEVVKFRRRKGYTRHQGHRQELTKVRVSEIHSPGAENGA